MFEAIKSFVADLAGNDRRADGFDDKETRLAMAALLVHAGTVDGDLDQAERVKLTALLRQRFDLDQAASVKLVEQATAADREAIDLYQFTHVLNRSLEQNGRLRLIEMMWQVAYADGSISEFENNLIWRVADLLGVSSTERIALRQRAAAASSGSA